MEKIADDLRELCLKADEVNRDNLMTILSDNRDTEYGKKYGFSDIHSFEDYRKKVPLVKYDDLKDYIRRMLDGEKNVLTAYPVNRYCSTSGTTGESKYIPMSDNDLDRKGLFTEDPKRLFLSSDEGKHLMISTFRTYSGLEGKKVFLLSEMYYKYIYDAGKLDPSIYVGGKDLFFVDEESPDIFYAKAAAALACDDIRIIECMFLYEVLNFFGYIERNWRMIVDGLRTHTLPDGLSVPENIRKYLLNINVSPERLDKIETECGNGFKGIAKRLWNKLEIVNGIGSKRYLTEETTLSEYLGDVSMQYYCYSCSECLIAVPPYLDECSYVMVLRTGAFEFLPYDTENEDITYQPHELEPGKKYEPVITNFSGLYRYRLGDIIRVKSFIGKSPVIEFLFRKDQAINLAGEKIDLNQLELTVYDLRKKGLNVDKYCIGPVRLEVPGKYFSVISVQNDPAAAHISDEAASELLDESLKQNSPDYKDLRGLGHIGKPEVLVCTDKEYEIFSELTGLESGRTHGKAKHIYHEEVPKEEWKRIINDIRKQQ